MNKHRAYYPIDETPQPNGDGAFRGVNALDDPGILGDGEVAYAENTRFDDGRAGTRGGVRIMTWAANRLGGDEDWRVRPFGGVLTGGTFSDPISGFEWTCIVTDAGVYRTRSGNQSIQIPLAAGLTTAGATELIQTYNGLILLRGRDASALYMESVTEGFKALPEPEAGREQMPPANFGIYFSNRVFLVDGRLSARYTDSIWVSDIGGVSSVLQGEDIYNNFKVNQGSADRLVGICKFNETTLIAGKESGIHVISNVTGTNTEMAAGAILDTVTPQYGCKAPRSFVQVGKDVWFLGHRRGICSITQTQQGKIQGVDVPVSRAIQPIIDRINWDYAHGVQAASSNQNRVYFAVPIDGATRNNAIIVYSTLNQKWAGIDTGAAMGVKRFLEFTWAGAKRLGFISHDGYVCLLEDGDLDHVGDANGVITLTPIPMTLRTRGYGGRNHGSKKFTRVMLNTRTLGPAYAVSLKTDGVNEKRTVATVTKSRTRYARPHGQAAWVTTNVNNDHGNPFREDYAIIPPIAFHAADGPAFGLMQQCPESWDAKGEGQYAQLEIVSTQGRVEIAGAAVDTIRGSSRGGTII